MNEFCFGKIDLGSGIVGVALVILMVLVGTGFFIGLWANNLEYKWVIEIILLFSLMIWIGLSTPIKAKDKDKKRVGRLFIDEKNQMSLSRFQLVFWTLIVISAYFTIALHNLNTGNWQNALIIQIPSELWAALGISLTALAGTNLIIGMKKGQEPKNQDAKSIVCQNELETDARFSDMFTGDELAECSNVNLAKLQMFFFTILILIAYFAILWHLMSSAGAQTSINQFPTFSQELATLLAISNGGYLLQKAAPSTPTN